MKPPTRTQRLPVHGLLIAVAYVAAHYGLSLLSTKLEIARNISVWYLPAGLLFGCLMAVPKRRMGWVLLGDVAARSIWAIGVYHHLALMAVALVISPLVYGGIALSLQSRRIRAGFETSLSMTSLFVGMVLAPAIAAPLNCLNYAADGVFRFEQLETIIPSFLIGDLVGIGTLAPLIMAAGSMITAADTALLRRVSWQSVAWTVLLPALAALALFAVFHSERPEMYTSGKFLMFVPLTILALREGWRGAAVAIVILNFSIVLALAVHQVPVAAIDIQLLLLSYSLFALILGVVIAERRQAEQLSDLLAAAAHSSPNALGIIDLRHPEHRFLFVNDAMMALTRQSEADLIRLSWRNLHHGDADRERLHYCADRIERRQPFETMMGFDRGGEVRLLRLKGGAVVGRDGQSLAYLISYSDITDEKRLEQIEREREKLISIGHLASGVAHELNNLIHPVINLSKMAKKKLERDTVKVSHYLDYIHNCGIKAGDIVHKVLMFAREKPASATAIPLGDAVQSAVDLIRTRVPPTITLELDNTAPTRLVKLGDTEVTQIVTNLVLNAAHAVAKDGRIGVTVSTVRLPDDAPAVALSAGPYLCLTVTDNGYGMDEATRRRIFDPFFSTKPVGEGTGLGLSVVYGLITVADGMITVDSEVGIGTSFRVYLPDVTEADGGCHGADTAG